MNSKYWMVVVLACVGLTSRAYSQSIDWDKAKEIHAKESRGETITDAEKAYLQAAKAAMQRGEGPKSADSTGEKQLPPNRDGVDFQKAKEIHDREARGEKISAAEQAYLEKAKVVMQSGNKAGDGTPTPPAAGGKDGIDWQRAQQLHQRAMRGDKLTPEEQAYYDRAKAARAGGGNGGGNNPTTPAQPNPGNRRTGEPKTSLDLVPLSDMTAEDRYKGEAGGLYGKGQNAPPEAHLKAALAAAKKIQPRNAEGLPDPNGKIVLISLGMSNTTQEFSEFVRIANADAAKSSNVVIVDCAQGGMEVMRWATAAGANATGPNPWRTLDERLRAAGVTGAQVQVAWIKQARAGPAAQGDYPKHADEQRGHYTVILNTLAERFPNLQIAYNSSRIYAGYAGSMLNPEPYAYEGAFVVRRLIQDQISGEATLNSDPARGKVTSPLLLWGPYLWANGEKGRKLDSLAWNLEDFGADGTHPSRSGQHKVAEQLLSFFKNDPTAKSWFVK